MLTGAGSRYNATNRWFDKTLQLGEYLNPDPHPNPDPDPDPDPDTDSDPDLD